MKQLIAFLVLITLAACKGNSNSKTHLPSKEYQYAKVDTAALSNKHTVYVPVYSHIYTEAGTSSVNLGATLSIRNTSFSDSFYVTDVVYYGSLGEILKRYLDSSLLIRPMSSVEFVVERTESKGGAGANFIVKWGANQPGISPLIQTVMVETATGISFTTNGVDIGQ